MAFATIKVKIDPSPRAMGKILDELGEAYADWTPAFRKMVPIFAREAPKGILTRGQALEDPDTWEPRASSTERDPRSGRAPLVRSGELVRSLANQHLSRVKITERLVRYSPGPQVDYAFPLHFGEDEVSNTGRKVKSLNRNDLTRHAAGTKVGGRSVGGQIVSGKRKRRTLEGKSASRSFRKQVRKEIRAFEKDQGVKLKRGQRGSFAANTLKDLELDRDASGERVPPRRLLGPTKGLGAQVERIMEEHAQRLIAKAIERINAGGGS